MSQIAPVGYSGQEYEIWFRRRSDPTPVRYGWTNRASLDRMLEVCMLQPDCETAWKIQLSACRNCGKSDPVICWPIGDDGYPSQGICPDCCAKVNDDDKSHWGHNFQYSRGDRTWVCNHCGQPADDEWLADREQD